MVTNPQKLQMRPIEQGPRLHIYSSMIRWCLCSLVILLAAYYVVQPLPLRARAAGPVQELPLVMVEIRYSIPEADEVFLVWGMNGWQQVPPEAQPVGTVIKDSLSYTPMERMDSAFIAKVQVPEGTTIDYVFQITKTRDGETRDIWDTNGAPKVDYHTVAQTGGIVEIQAPPAIEYQVALKKGHYWTLLARPGAAIRWRVRYFRDYRFKETGCHRRNLAAVSSLPSAVYSGKAACCYFGFCFGSIFFRDQSRPLCLGR